MKGKKEVITTVTIELNGTEAKMINMLMNRLAKDFRDLIENNSDTAEDFGDFLDCDIDFKVIEDLAAATK